MVCVETCSWENRVWIRLVSELSLTDAYWTGNSKFDFLKNEAPNLVALDSRRISSHRLFFPLHSYHDFPHTLCSYCNVDWYVLSLLCSRLCLSLETYMDNVAFSTLFEPFLSLILMTVTQLLFTSRCWISEYLPEAMLNINNNNNKKILGKG